jgi:hypothetical protein
MTTTHINAARRAAAGGMPLCGYFAGRGFPFLYSASMRSPSHSPASTSMGLRCQTIAISRRRSHCSGVRRAGTRPVRFGFLSGVCSALYAGLGMGHESNTACDMPKVYPYRNCLATKITRHYYTRVTCNHSRTETAPTDRTAQEER